MPEGEGERGRAEGTGETQPASPPAKAQFDLSCALWDVDLKKSEMTGAHWPHGIRYCRVYSTSWVLRHQRQHRAVWPAKPCRGCRRCCWRRSPVRRTRRGVGWTRISSTASTTCRSTRAPRARARRSGWPAACRTPSWRSRRGASRRRAAAASTTGSSTSLRPRSPGTKVATSSRSSTLGRPTWCRGWRATTRWRAAARTAAASRRRGDACGRTTGRCARPPAASPVPARLATST